MLEIQNIQVNIHADELHAYCKCNCNMCLYFSLTVFKLSSFHVNLLAHDLEVEHSTM